MSKFDSIEDLKKEIEGWRAQLSTLDNLPTESSKSKMMGMKTKGTAAELWEAPGILKKSVSEFSRHLESRRIAGRIANWIEDYFKLAATSCHLCTYADETWVQIKSEGV